jgi:hypothetical protein
MLNERDKVLSALRDTEKTVRMHPPIERGMFRNRRLLDLAHGIDICQNCGRGRSEGMDPAHSNLEEHGKGFKLKAHDCFFAALCNLCHSWLDNSGGRGFDPSGRYHWDRDGKREMFVRAMHATWLLLWRAGKVKVA